MGKPVKPFSSEFNQLALSVGLSKNDIKEIKTILMEFGITKPYLIFSDPALLDKIIHENTENIEKLNLPPEEKQKRLLLLFEIKRKVYNHYHNIREGIRSSMEIEPNQFLSMSVAGLGKFYSVVIINDKKNLVISLPEVKDAQNLAWKDRQVEIYFWRYDDAGYLFKTRIENVVSDRMQALILAHQNNLKRIQRREYPRRKCRFDTKFFKFSLSTNDKGKPVMLLGKTNVGYLIDISPSGASLVSETGLPKNSSVKVEFKIADELVSGYGKLINVSKKKNMNVMHIQFQRISDRSKNLIYKYVYKYI